MRYFKKFRDIFLGILIGSIAVTLIPVVYASKGDISQVAPFTTDSLWLLKQARVIVEAYQVDAASNDVSESEMVHGAMRGMLGAWKDPYTRFLDPEQLEDEKTSLEGSFGGLGINIASRDGKILIINPIEGTPADKAGLRPMDEIVRVNDDIVIGWELDKVVKLLRGDPGTSVTVGIRRINESKLLDFKITRDTIKIDTVHSEMLKDNVGYIRLRQFIKTSAADVGKAVIDLKNKKAKGLILDLRNNGGGLLDAACDICDLFIDGGLIVSTKGRVDSANEEYYAHEGVLTDLPLVVLINEGSASASEIVSGALRDRNNTLLIGAKSFGKGSVQVLFNLSDGSGMFVTTARYFTPNGVRIDHVGLTPDIYVKSVWNDDIADNTETASTDVKLKSENISVDKDKNNSTSDKKDLLSWDLQLKRAHQTVLRLVAGELPENLKDPVTVSSDDISINSGDRAVENKDNSENDSKSEQSQDIQDRSGDVSRDEKTKN
jgi:carboxyl-terminal processing protease